MKTKYPTPNDEMQAQIITELPLRFTVSRKFECFNSSFLYLQTMQHLSDPKKLNLISSHNMTSNEKSMSFT